MIYYLPLENIEQRYTKMMNLALKPLVDVYLYPEFNLPEVIEKGEFLDVNKTSIFKAKQLQMVAELFYNGEIKDGDHFLVGDIFFPGIEMIKYMSELQGIEVKISGFNYAGRADKTDFVQQLGRWADHSERGYHEICENVFVGSLTHLTNIEKHFNPSCKIIPTGYVWSRDYVRSIFDKQVEKEDFIIFPHRLSSEKGIDELIEYANQNPDKKIVVTSSGNKREISLPANIEYVYGLSKAEYYEIMAKAKYYLSFAYQETFGYTLQEAIHFGCEIAVPNRACYAEFVPAKCLFEGINVQYHKVPMSYTDKWDNNAEKIINWIKK